MLKSALFMIGLLAATPVLAASDAGAPVTPAVSPPATLDAERALLAEAEKHFSDDDLKAAGPMFAAVIAAPSFASLGGADRHLAFSLLGWTQLEAKQYADALSSYRQATEFEEANHEDWLNRAKAADQTKDLRDELVSLSILLRRWPGDLDIIHDKYFIELMYRSKTHKEFTKERFELFKILNEIDWKPSEPLVNADLIWIILVQDFLDHNEIDKARALALRIEDPQLIEDMRIDKRFDALTQTNLSAFDVKRALIAYVAKRRAQASANPNRLAAANHLADALRKNGQSKDALAVIDAALARARPTDGSKSPYTDMDQINWTMNQREWALFALGRADEALAQLISAARMLENGHANVSQQLNLGESYLERGKPLEALEAVKRVPPENINPHGLMVAAYLRTCAYAQLGDQVGLPQALDYVRGHTADAPSIAIDALICANDLDGAAKIIVEELNDPDHIIDMLEKLQDSATPSSADSLFYKIHRQRLLLIRARPEVQVAINRVGRIELSPF